MQSELYLLINPVNPWATLRVCVLNDEPVFHHSEIMYLRLEKHIASQESSLD